MALIRVNTTWVGSAGAPFYTQLYFLGAGDAAHALDAVTAVDTFLDGIASQIDNALSWTISGDVEVIDVSNGQITSVVPVATAVGSGADAGEALPPFTQLLCQLRTGTFLNGRNLRGRIFIPGQMEHNNTVDGRPSAGYTSSVQPALTDFVNDSADLAVYSRTHASASSVQTSSIWSEWAVLRSRRP